jgi:hypothetical protein
MQELNMMEVDEVGGRREQVTGFMFYILTGGLWGGGKIIFKEDDGSTTVYNYN